MTITLEYEVEGKNYALIDCLKECPYRAEDHWGLKPIIGSISCKVCQYHKGHNYENKTVECSYEYDHLSEEEQKVIYENI